jgi:hypothetical protein
MIPQKKTGGAGRVSSQFLHAALAAMSLLFTLATALPAPAQGTRIQQSEQILSLTGTADDHEHDSLGTAAAISSNGKTMVVGAVNGNGVEEGTGAVYIFDKLKGQWVETAKLFADDGTATPEPDGKFANDSFGINAAISEDGNTVIVGAPNHGHPGFPKDSGAVYVYQRAKGVWSQQMELRSPAPNNRTEFGAGDGFGGIGISGNTIIVTDQGPTVAFLPGNVDVFTFTNGNWTLTAQLTAPDDFSFFPSSAAISGNTVVVGSSISDSPSAFQSGVAYVFRFHQGQWSGPVTLTASDATSFGQFGSSVSIDGNLIAVGAITQPGLTGQSGAAYVFASQGGAWSQTTKLVANDGQDFDNFGFSISSSGQTVFVGSSSHTPLTTGVLQAGSAYVFQGDDGWWRQTAELAASDGIPSGDYGTAVAVQNNTLLVGADLHHPAVEGYAGGEAYVYRLNPQD